MTDKTIDINDKYKYKPLTEIKTIYVNPENRITSEVMTKFEYCQVIGIRAKQLEDYDNPFTDVGDISDPIEMAKKELLDNKCPLYVKRFIGLNKYELWSPNVMSKPHL